MSASPEHIVRRWFQELWTDGNEIIIDELLAPDAVVHGLTTPTGERIVGPQGFRPLFHHFQGAFPDMRISIGPVVCQGDWVAAHCDVTGTHRGPGFGSPTHEPIHFTGITMVRTKNGKLVEGWNAFDFLTCFQQIRLLPKL
jgi:predicted ester cyclase